MLEEFLKEYLNIDKLEDIININVDNLTNEGKLFYNLVCDYNFSLDEILPEIISEINLQTGFSFSVEHKKKVYSYSTEETAPALAPDGSAQTYYEDHYNVVDAIILNDHLNNVKSTLTEKETVREFTPSKWTVNYKLINEEIHDYININKFKNSKFGPIFAKIIYNILIKHLKKEEDKVIGIFKAYYELQLLNSFNKLEKIKIKKKNLKSSLNKINIKEEKIQKYQNKSEELIKKIEILDKKIDSLPSCREICGKHSDLERYSNPTCFKRISFKDFYKDSPYIFYLVSLNGDLNFEVKRVTTNKINECDNYNSYKIDEIIQDDYNPYGVSFRMREGDWNYSKYIFVFVEWPKEICELISLNNDLKKLLASHGCFDLHYDFDLTIYNNIKKKILDYINLVPNKYAKLFDKNYCILQYLIGEEVIKTIAERDYLIHYIEQANLFNKNYKGEMTRIEYYKKLKKESMKKYQNRSFIGADFLQSDDDTISDYFHHRDNGYCELNDFISWFQNRIIEFDNFFDEIPKYNTRMNMIKEQHKLKDEEFEIYEKLEEIEKNKCLHNDIKKQVNVENRNIKTEKEIQRYLISQINKINELDYKEEIKLARKK